MPELIPAHITLDTTGTPFAPAFEDCYFSRHNGLAEARYVFLQGNQLPERWQSKPFFTIAETGFGTGLNFLATWQAWGQDPQRCERLHFVSIEKYPISKQQLQTLLAAWPELQPYADELLAQYPPLLKGFHRLQLAQGRISLTLCFMDVLEALAECVMRVDAWYLDGFAPARNPDMWQLPVFQAMANLSHVQTTLATFTAAGEVRRQLQQAGFQMEKRAGFGQKREMLVGKFTQSPSQALIKPWFAVPEPLATRQATVIGGGIAGCQIAYALAERGWQVELVERHKQVAQEASGNRAGVLTPKMTAEAGWGETFYRQAFLYAIRQVQNLQAQGHPIEWSACGALQLAHEQREYERQQALKERDLPDDFIQILDTATASAVAGISLPVGASYFPQGGWLNPASLCQALVNHPRIAVHTSTESLQPASEGITILANGREADQWLQSAFLPFVPVMGQTSHASVSAYSRELKTTLGHEGYLTPSVQGVHVFGATFGRGIRNALVANAADEVNHQQLKQYLPELAEAFTPFTSGHAAIRMTTPDRYPMVGALPAADSFYEHYADLHHGRMHQVYPPAVYQPNIYISAGYGSRGLTTSGLCAELLACLLTGEPLPLQATLYQQLHPARFLIRQLRRR